MRTFVIFLATALLSFWLQLQTSGCVVRQECSCPRTPALPPPQAAIVIDEAKAFTARGDLDTLPLDPTGGTAEISGEHLTIRYLRQGLERVVTYDIASF